MPLVPPFFGGKCVDSCDAQSACLQFPGAINLTRFVKDLREERSKRAEEMSTEPLLVPSAEVPEQSASSTKHALTCLRLIHRLSNPHCYHRRSEAGRRGESRTNTRFINLLSLAVGIGVLLG